MPNRISSPHLFGLVSATGPAQADKRAIDALIRRYGAGATLEQARAQAQAAIDRATEGYKAMKARGEAL